MTEKIVQIIFEFYSKFVGPYVSAYFLWLTEKLRGVEPFTALSISILLIFALVIYIWFRNRE
jgi:hypothetical protein